MIDTYRSVRYDNDKIKLPVGKEADDMKHGYREIMEHSNTEQELTSICFDATRIAVTFFEEA